ncbi:tim [Bugula neritina]|uniref:Tim n=1 Tax=Bugula neritina TaxID=10212 RepID=A0A7J7K0U6_BUGNE|nr:tim [Bugula neritina]
MNDLNLFSLQVIATFRSLESVWRYYIEEGQQTSMVLAMEWYIMNSTGVRSLTCNLGELVSPGTYILHDSCADVMEELLVRIANEEENKYITKRHILAEQLLAKDLIPMIKYGSPDVNELQLLLRLLSELCQPCDADQTVAMPPDKYAYPDLKRLSSQVCEAFLDREFTSRLFTHIHELIEEAGELEMVQESYLSIKYLFTAIRNVLYLMRSEKENFTKLLSLLLENDLDSVLIYSINCHGRDELVLPAAQILSLLYSEFEWLRTEAEGAKEQDATCITDRLKRIVVQLLQGSLSALAISLMRKELKDGSDVEGSYLSWCLTYFLPYVSYVPVPLAKFRGVLSNKCVGYLVYQLSALVPGLFGGDPTSRSTQRIKERMNRCMLLLSAFDSLLSLVFNFSLPSADKEDVTVAMQFYSKSIGTETMFHPLHVLFKRCSKHARLVADPDFYIRNFDITMFPALFYPNSSASTTSCLPQSSPTTRYLVRSWSRPYWSMLNSLLIKASFSSTLYL